MFIPNRELYDYTLFYHLPMELPGPINSPKKLEMC